MHQITRLKKMIPRLVASRGGTPQTIFHSLLVDDLGITRIPVCSLSSSSASSDETDMFDRLNHKDWLAPNEVLKIFRRLKNPESIISALERISKRMDYKPNEAFYTLVIEKLSQGKKFDAIDDVLKRIKTEKNCRLSDGFFYGVIKIYGNVAGILNKAIETLFSMPEFNCWPEVRTFNLVLNMLVSAKQFDVIHEVYLGASQLGIAVDACCLNILIKGLCECDKLDAAFALLDEFPKQGLRPNVKTYSTLMHYLCEHGRVDEAFKLSERMDREGCHPDTITFNILIQGLCKQGRVDEGKELLDRMRLKGCYPDLGSYQQVLYGLLSSGKFVEAKCFIEWMVSKGVFPSFRSYKLVLEGLLQENLLEDVDSILKQMVQRGFVPRMGIWNKILKSMFQGTNSYSCISYSEIIYE
ncbi:PREDICTED: pentatricopeptide repeat-containing protein At3g14580, mitochondrial-like [Nelumbo nucifera]|uniref:Pentatricopeptide repeat-containing protein At3g14580, mitochondrial-like n=1 Tax=Nelumbo nucifera TaxID=4432 RepID=A0A1U7ZVQ3_NELNU|nr:PREDICTED: pentatricopeptide repeat-containing protein At3g14580, mitochondrial-like [Nelumbo nucifera]XP_010257755.1 PREDICTED: pentatricopeptide repeat-containing protein At3g14580, mitochondrial-like [Nelumbo nucifera]XP_010257756.1 PREDICTED: pentatricopeptide repeat-containing protein At3g14580, mitochondrial-like [Nelumbo nucifera]XP_010257757.1 PREDICTED: pentatricopeptide repeat-containing protein At3g14580, mitochondrial-like [Nelumbo nucifera]XP_010257758.1 PREDICTED: pentatricopep